MEKELASRDEAKMFIIREQLTRPGLGPVALSYLRGVRYKSERPAPGGDRRSCAVVFKSLKTAEALAEIFEVSPRTIRRDGAIAYAVHKIMANCGPYVRQLLLAREARLNRQAVVDLARLPAETQRSLVWELQTRGKLPRGWRNGGARTTATLPRILQIALQGDASGLATARWVRHGAASVLRSSGKPQRRAGLYGPENCRARREGTAIQVPSL